MQKEQKKVSGFHPGGNIIGCAIYNQTSIYIGNFEEDYERIPDTEPQQTLWAKISEQAVFHGLVFRGDHLHGDVFPMAIEPEGGAAYPHR